MSGSQANFGIWIFGDLSFNNLQVWFTNSDSSIIQSNLENIDWTGWKFKEIDLSTWPEAKFNSLVVVQNKLGAKSGQLYFDNVLTNIVTDAKISENNLPTDFRLEQNYPNPFNPTTTIKYTIPTNSFIPSGVEGYDVRMTIYDVLGREIKTLVNEVKTPGNYEITFDATNLPSGVYYYRLKSNDFVQTKKMLLLK
ncbi:MAG: T9SS type A sorting domain-containing protein [Ignavibacteriales bacterium]|nr:T9SS type A sorting domain-containing protein [Ignavibacteriales bacterium]